MADVLERLGYQVDFPEEQTCCGQPAFNSGYRAEARTVARHFLKTFEASESNRGAVGLAAPRWSTIISRSCSRRSPRRWRGCTRWRKRVYEFSTFLTEVAGVEDVGARLDDMVTFHDGCHGAARTGHQRRRRAGCWPTCADWNCARWMPAEECCGFGGTFAVKFAELSGAMARTKIEAIVRTGRQHRGLAGPQLPDADSGRPFARRARTCAPCTWPRFWPAAKPMSVEFDRKIHDTLADANLQLAIYTATGRLKEKRIAACRGRRAARLSGTAHAGQRPQEAHHREPGPLPGRVRAQRGGPRRQGGLLQGRAPRSRISCSRWPKSAARRLIVKSKSMTTEEVDLNERLEHHGLESVETDLGEYILQLAHERPYHIVAPALHMTRYDVARSVRRRAARAARDGAREADADGARRCCARNFWRPISASAAPISWWPIRARWCIVENEGNARLTTSAPKIHIAVAGIEKVIPRAQDLATFLKLLARSATGPAALGVHVVSSAGRGARARSTGRKSSTWCCWITGAPSCCPTEPSGNRSTASAAARA